jgi:flagellar protein FliO/FliZ
MNLTRTLAFGLFASALTLAGVQAEASLPKKQQKSKEKPVIEALAAESEEALTDELIGAKLVIDSDAGDTSAASTFSVEGGETLKIDTEKLPEDKIPVLAGAKEAKKASTSPFNKMMFTLGVLALLLGALCLGLRRWIKANPKLKQNTKIKVITQHHLGPKKSLAIVNVAGESLLIGVTDHNISMLKTLSLLEEELPEDVPRNFNRAMDDFQDEEEAFEPSRPSKAARSRVQHEDEDFTISGLSEIRDSVSGRLRNMKSF